MNKEELEEKVIELYEEVAIGAITPNEARGRFMILIDKWVGIVIGDKESNKKTYDPFYHDELLEMQRKRAE
jgi:hypothetical protein